MAHGDARPRALGEAAEPSRARFRAALGSVVNSSCAKSLPMQSSGKPGGSPCR